MLMKQEPQLLMRKSLLYLLIYSFKRKYAFDACFDAEKVGVRFKKRK